MDKYTVRFVNATPDVTLEGRLSTTASGIISARAFDEAESWLDYARKPVGTGPCKIREYRLDNMCWDDRPPPRTLRIVEVPEVSGRVNGLLAGEYQFACDMPPDQITEIERHPGFEVLGGVIPNIRTTIFDKNHARLRDPRVRQAMTHAIDRKTIVESLWAGKTVVPAGLRWSFHGGMYVRGWTVPDFDPKKARESPKAAGYKGDPIPYRLLNNYYASQVANARVLVEMWKDAGLNVVIGMKENWSRIFEGGDTRGITTGPTAPASTTRSPPSSASTARTASNSSMASGPTPR